MENKEEIISEKQKKEMLHSLGLDWKNKPYRNFFNTFIDDEDWNDLVQKGLAGKRLDSSLIKGTCYYFVTEEGAKLLGVKLPDD